MASAIRVSNLTKKYGQHIAVSNASFEVPLGSVCGFVGPNGSGKTTTIRMLLGLISPTTGTAHVLDASIGHPEKYLPRVGAMIEGPAFYPALSGRDNLKVLATIGKLSHRRIDELLELVGLADRAKSKFKTYSLGMKQRLGIAASLLPNPDLLILDEPTNGLDPAGIHEMRTLLKDLANNGTTVFVSSHLLSELEMISDHLVMLRQGNVIFSGSTDDLLMMQQPTIVARPEHAVDLETLAELVRTLGKEVEMQNESIRVLADSDFSGQLNRKAFENGITLCELSIELPTLEETFFDMTGDAQ